MKYCLLIILLLFSFPANSQNSEIYTTAISSTKLNLINEENNKWYFKADDSLEFSKEHIDTNGWITTRLYKMWRTIPGLKDFRGPAWYRLYLDIPEQADYALFIPRHNRAIQLYFNGKFIGETNPVMDGKAPHTIAKPQLVIIPSEEIKKGVNVLAFRAFELDGFSGMIQGLAMGNVFEITRYWTRFILINGTLSIVMIFLFAYFFMQFLLRKKDLFYLYYSLLCLSLSMWITGYSGLGNYIIDDYLVYVFFTYWGGILSFLMTILFLHSLYGYKLNKFSLALISFYSILLLIPPFNFLIDGTNYFFNVYIFNPFSLSSFISAGYFSYLVIRSIREKKPFAIYVACGISVLIIVVLLGALRYMGVLSIPSYMSEGFFIMNLCFSLLLIHKFAKVHTDLEKSHEDLKVLDRMKDDFLATTSHEFRTPLHGIIGLSESIADGSLGPVNEEQLESIGLIRQSASQLNRLVSDILDFSRLNAGRADLLIREMDLGSAIKTVISLIRPTVRDIEVRITDVIEDIPKIRADPDRVRQILMNLVGNAVKFTDRGTVTVRARRHGDDMVAVTVEDTGPGISGKDMERIFSPFERAADPDTQKAGGAGLGLAISKRLVELHGGTVTAESRIGEGSAFTFTLPVRPVIRGIEKTSSAEFPMRGGMSETALMQGLAENEFPDPGIFQEIMPARSQAVILAVDDDPVNLKVLGALCARAGHKIVTAADGPEALQKIQDTGIDLVLLDLMLPGMSGFEVCQKIRSMKEGERLPIIVVTARDQASDLVKGFKTGANDYITKPFNRNELLMRIENQLAIKHMLDMERSVVNELRMDRDSISNLFQRSVALKESAIQMAEWEHIIRDDLDIARQFQMKLMTHGMSVPAIDSYVHYRPLLQIGGDIYDIFEVRPGVLRVFLADATGHGINASLNTVKILSEYAVVKETLAAPADVVNHLNRRFVMFFRDYQIVFTCVLADIDTVAGSVTMTTPGHPGQFLLSRSGAAPVKIRGPIIGLTDEISYEDRAYEFNPGDALVLFTDGVFEYYDRDRNFHRNQSLADTGVFDEIIALGPSSQTAEEIARRMMDHFAGAGAGVTIDDDVTLLVLKHR